MSDTAVSQGTASSASGDAQQEGGAFGWWMPGSPIGVKVGVLVALVAALIVVSLLMYVVVKRWREQREADDPEILGANAIKELFFPPDASNNAAQNSSDRISDSSKGWQKVAGQPSGSREVAIEMHAFSNSASWAKMEAEKKLQDKQHGKSGGWSQRTSTSGVPIQAMPITDMSATSPSSNLGESSTLSQADSTAALLMNQSNPHSEIRCANYHDNEDGATSTATPTPAHRSGKRFVQHSRGMSSAGRSEAATTARASDVSGTDLEAPVADVFTPVSDGAAAYTRTTATYTGSSTFGGPSPSSGQTSSDATSRPRTSSRNGAAGSQNQLQAVTEDQAAMVQAALVQLQQGPWLLHEDMRGSFDPNERAIEKRLFGLLQDLKQQHVREPEPGQPVVAGGSPTTASQGVSITDLPVSAILGGMLNGSGRPGVPFTYSATLRTGRPITAADILTGAFKPTDVVLQVKTTASATSSMGGQTTGGGVKGDSGGVTPRNAAQHAFTSTAARPLTTPTSAIATGSTQEVASFTPNLTDSAASNSSSLQLTSPVVAASAFSSMLLQAAVSAEINAFMPSPSVPARQAQRVDHIDGTKSAGPKIHSDRAAQIHDHGLPVAGLAAADVAAPSVAALRMRQTASTGGVIQESQSDMPVSTQHLQAHEQVQHRPSEPVPSAAVHMSAFHQQNSHLQSQTSTAPSGMITGQRSMHSYNSYNDAAAGSSATSPRKTSPDLQQLEAQRSVQKAVVKHVYGESYDVSLLDDEDSPFGDYGAVDPAKASLFSEYLKMSGRYQGQPAVPPMIPQGQQQQQQVTHQFAQSQAQVEPQAARSHVTSSGGQPVAEGVIHSLRTSLDYPSLHTAQQEQHDESQHDESQHDESQHVQHSAAHVNEADSGRVSGPGYTTRASSGVLSSQFSAEYPGADSGQEQHGCESMHVYTNPGGPTMSSSGADATHPQGSMTASSSYSGGVGAGNHPTSLTGLPGDGLNSSPRGEQQNDGDVRNLFPVNPLFGRRTTASLNGATQSEGGYMA